MTCHHANFDRFGRCGYCGAMAEPRDPRPSDDLALLLAVLQRDCHSFAPMLERTIEKVRDLETFAFGKPEKDITFATSKA